MPTNIRRKTKTAAKSKRLALYPLTAKISLMVKENPHRVGTNDHGKYRKLANGMTVETALRKVDSGYLRYMVGRELISIA